MDEFIGYIVVAIFLAIRAFVWFLKQKKKRATVSSSHVEVEEDFLDEEMEMYEMEKKPLKRDIPIPPLQPAVNIPKKPERKQKNSLQKYIVFHEILKKPKSLEEDLLP